MLWGWGARVCAVRKSGRVTYNTVSLRARRCARGAWARAVSNVGDDSVSENDVFIYKVMP